MKVSLMGTSLAMAEMTNTFIPTGGEISPGSTTMSPRIPNQILRSSLSMPNAASTASASSPPFMPTSTGQKNGIARRIIDRLSIRQPSRISAISRMTKRKPWMVLSTQRNVVETPASQRHRGR